MTKDKTTKGAELVLKLKKDELFDPMVLLPHSEINAAVYEAVEQFAERQDAGAELLITIFSDGTGPLMREKFRESFLNTMRMRTKSLTGISGATSSRFSFWF